MNEIKALVQPFMLDGVLNALHEIEGVAGITVSEVRAISAEHGQYARSVKPRVELMVPEPLVERVVEAIRRSAHTGNPGAGKMPAFPGGAREHPDRRAGPGRAAGSEHGGRVR